MKSFSDHMKYHSMGLRPSYKEYGTSTLSTVNSSRLCKQLQLLKNSHKSRFNQRIEVLKAGFF